MSAVPPGCPLTKRQYQVLQLISEGHTRKQVAVLLGVTLSTIRIVNTRAFAALGVHSAAHAIAVMGRNGWFDWEEPTPLAAVSPFGAAVVDAFDRWLESGFSDQDARDAMHMAAEGACLVRRVRPRVQASSGNALRELLQHVAWDTLVPTRRTD